MSCAIGFTIGFLIPTWYREAPREGELVADLKLADRIQPLRLYGLESRAPLCPGE